MKRILIVAFVLLSLLYAGDFVSVRFRIPKNRDPFGLVKVKRYYAVGLKSGKTEFMFLDPENRVCVHSLFPHFGDPPCWYLSRRNVRRVDF